MCIIVYKPQGIEMPSKKDLELCFKANPDGAGLMWPGNDGLVHIRKGFMDWESFRDFAYSKDFKGKPVVMHFRITTQGGVQKGLTHPFPVSGNYEAMRWLSLKAPMGIAHNGIIASTSDGAKDHNDTMRFIKDIAYPVLKSHGFKDPDGVLCKALGDAANGSRLAIMDGTGKVTLTGTWSKRGDGCMYSNLFAFASLRSNYGKMKAQTATSALADGDDWWDWRYLDR